MKLILLSGKQGSGKTTLQKYLVNMWAKKACMANFADVIYEMHWKVLEILHKYVPKRDLVKDGPLLQLLGTEWGRKTIHEDIWVETLSAKLKHLEAEGYDLVVIGDCRFPNEFVAFPEALRVRLKASPEARRARCEMWRPNDTHPSEVGLDAHEAAGAFDLVLDTEGLHTDACANRIYDLLAAGDWQEHRTKVAPV